jgi:hypothetical protein
MLSVAAAFLLGRLGLSSSHVRLGLLVGAAILLDFGGTANLVLGQPAIFALGARVRSRLNDVYMAVFFAGGAAGSALGGWSLSCWGRFGLPLLALASFLVKR